MNEVRIFKLEVEACFECPACDWGQPVNKYVCNVNDKVINNVSKIPKWCKLEKVMK